MRLAFIGGWGHAYVRHLLTPATAAFDLPIAVASDGHDAERAKAFAASLGVPTVWFDTAEDLLEQYKPDVVNVGAVYGYHGEVAARVLRRGVRVITEKAPAATWAQLDAIRATLAAAPGGSLRLITEFAFRSLPEFRAARDAVRQGLIGDIVMATAQKSYRFGNRPKWYGSRKDYGSTLLWVASHGIDVIHFITGQTYTKVTGRLGNLSHPELPEMDDHCLSLFGLSGGGSAMVHADLLRPAKAASHGDDRLRIVGTKGQIEVRDERCRLTTNDAAEIDITSRAKVQSAGEELLAAVMGKDDSIYSTQQSLYMAKVLLHARDAADQQAWVTIG